jgi:hypothetical protein
VLALLRKAGSREDASRLHGLAPHAVRPNRSAIWIICALVTASASCAATQAKREREEYLAARLDSLRYRQPLDEVWAEMRRVLTAKGYPLVGQDAEAVGESHGLLYSIFSPAKETSTDEGGARFLETGWRKDQTRYHVEGVPDGTGCRVVFTMLREDPTEHGHDARERKRGVELELELARRVDPEAAAEIEAGLQAMKRN